MSTRSAPAGPLDNMEKFLNIFEIERVIKDLKSSFETEYKDLMEDIEYLNGLNNSFFRTNFLMKTKIKV